MPRLTIVYGLILIAVGVVAFIARGAATALIPAYFGIPFVVLGAVALKESLRKHAMHAAAALVLIVILGLTPMVLKGYNPERPWAFPTQLVALVSSIGYLVMSVRSFIEARRRRLSEQN